MDQSLLLPLLTIINGKQSANTLSNAFLLLLVHIIITNYVLIIKYIKDQIPKIRNGINYPVKASITLKHNTLWSCDFPCTFLALSQKLKSTIVADKSFTSYKILQYPSYKKDPVTILDLHTSYKVVDDIYVYTNISNRKSDNNEYDYINVEYVLHSKKKSCQEIEDFLSSCLEHYKLALLDTMKSQHIFMFKEIDEENHDVVYQEYPFETTKSFGNMFFDQKDELLRRVDYFTNNKAEYVRLGIPYTLGILLHGIPGGGKTSYIKGLAKHTGRHLVVLPTRNIKNIETLKMIFLNEDINGVKIPNSKRIYIMEEIDCSEWRSVVLSRSLRKDDKQDDEKTNTQDALVDALVTLNKSDDDDKKKHKPKKNESNTLTLGDFLELLDGIVEIPGRMLVMSSNHPEVLDPALVRPGRIDMVIEFKKLTRKSVRDVYKHWFNKDIPNDVYANMKDYMFSQADIGNMFTRCSQTEIYRTLCGKN